jgi:hypothetical protein
LPGVDLSGHRDLTEGGGWTDLPDATNLAGGGLMEQVPVTVGERSTR